jgi:hypothetical protein
MKVSSYISSCFVVTLLFLGRFLSFYLTINLRFLVGRVELLRVFLGVLEVFRVCVLFSRNIEVPKVEQ